jgi:hypothetical protein
MRFRLVAAVALWTMISGPIFAPSYPTAPARQRAAAPAKHVRPARPAPDR